MENKIQVNVFQKWIDDPNTNLPMTIGGVLTPLIPELGKLTIIHPTPIDPVLVSDKFGAIAIWFEF